MIKRPLITPYFWGGGVHCLIIHEILVYCSLKDRMGYRLTPSNDEPARRLFGGPKMWGSIRKYKPCLLREGRLHTTYPPCFFWGGQAVKLLVFFGGCYLLRHFLAVSCHIFVDASEGCLSQSRIKTPWSFFTSDHHLVSPQIFTCNVVGIPFK